MFINRVLSPSKIKTHLEEYSFLFTGQYSCHQRKTLAAMKHNFFRSPIGINRLVFFFKKKAKKQNLTMGFDSFKNAVDVDNCVAAMQQH